MDCAAAWHSPYAGRYHTPWPNLALYGDQRMRKALTTFLSFAALAVAFSATPAHAQRGMDTGSGFYLGGALGASNTNVDNGSLASVGFATTSTDESDFAWNVNAGYKFTRNIAV